MWHEVATDRKAGFCYAAGMKPLIFLPLNLLRPAVKAQGRPSARKRRVELPWAVRAVFARSGPAMGLALGLLGGVVLTGCGKSLKVHDSGAFNAAAPELKAKWDTAMAAWGTNGYLVTYNTLQDLRGQSSLSADQAKAVDEFIGVVGTKMFNAANKGDPEATKAVKEIQSNRRR